MSSRLPALASTGLVVLLAVAAATGGSCMFGMPGRSHRGPLEPLDSAGQDLAARLHRHVEVLASEIGERHVWRPEALDRTRSYIREQLEAQGLEVRAQTYRAEGVEVANLEVELPGDARGEEIVVVGAHYDTVPGTPGANDNASGVAVVLELARLLRDTPRARSLRLVAFVNEEPPFFHTEQMGSLVYARASAERGDRIVAMLAAETLGYYDTAPGSQHYPFPFSLFYPDTGDFVGFVGDRSSRALVRRCVGSFRRHAGFPSEGAALPAAVEGIDWSDHWAFWQVGVPALMVTDTAPFRFPHYHEAADTLELVDTERLARVTRGLAAVIVELLDEPR